MKMNIDTFRGWNSVQKGIILEFLAEMQETGEIPGNIKRSAHDVYTWLEMKE